MKFKPYRHSPSAPPPHVLTVSLLGSWCMWAADVCGQLVYVDSWWMWAAGVDGQLVYVGSWCMWAAGACRQ